MSDGRQLPQPVAPHGGESSVDQWSPSSFCLASVLLPGAGQFAQRRFIAGAVQLATVLAYLAMAVSTDAGEPLLLAVAWNVWSAVDAYWNA